MKCFSFLLCLMCVPASASFYDELHGAMRSVQQGFGKLLSDVVIDVTDTVHCTISAVEHVLTLNGFMKTRSQYGHKCRHAPAPVIDDNNDPLKNFLKLRDAIEERTFKDTGPKDLHASIAKVNSTLTNALDNHESQRKIETISKVLKDETDQLTKVSNILRQELNSISNNINTELQKFEHELAPTVWSELERKRNNEDNTVVHHTTEAPQKLGSGNIEMKKPDNDQYSFNKVKREFEHLRDDVQEPTDNFPKTFRDVVKNIRNNNQNEDMKTHKKINSGSVFSVDNSNFDKFSPFYDPGTGNEDIRKKVVEQTVSIISDSKHNEDLMNKLFNQAQVSSVFGDNSRMFNF